MSSDKNFINFKNMHSIKTKLIVAISLLIIGIMSIAAWLLIQEKEKELTADIYNQVRSFADLSSERVIGLYEEFLAKDAFVPFKREFVKVLAGSSDLENLKIVDFSGMVLFDLNAETDARYSDEKREIKDAILIDRIKSSYLSVSIAENGETIYLIRNERGLFDSVDQNLKPIEDIAPGIKIASVVAPVANKYAVIYEVSYVNLDSRIAAMQERILLLAIFAVLIGLLVGYVLAHRITNPIAILNQGVLTIATGDFKKRVTVKSKDEVGQLAESFNKMAHDLEISTKALVYKERVAKELELAAKIQKELLPTTIPQVKGMDIAAGLIPAAEIGGDCFDFIVNSDDSLISYIGDVTGHGVPSGLVVAVANAIVYSLASQQDILKIMIESNKIIKAKTGPNMFLTMLMTHWNAKDEKFSYVVAGHDPIVLYKAQENKVYQLKEGGMALGMIPDISKLLKCEDLELEKGDVAVLYTDGIPEAWANEKDSYGMGRLKRAVGEFAVLPTADEIKKAILADVKSFMGSYEQKDDITLMIYKRT